MAMKRFTGFFALAVIVALIAAPLGITACSHDNWMRNSYRVMVSAAATYNVVMESAADAHRNGDLSDENFSRLKDSAQVYYDAYQKAADVLITVAAETEKGGTPSEALMRLLNERIARVGELVRDLLSMAGRVGLELEEVK